ncbi:hypothetical protein GCK72_004313 [Caenorhabditis remanei]|uniref:Uncharacterized protein n=1 Tax=Caenorhabditis remanei TaxID=31234 RepID=A0A6A5HC05_CAERE|nr:hypothetical protein GCK72_004313 [Caenorhabditis remanei]KAF1764366.1 hypothetical protein GCK72_004313 [Caenorhabditis remanei]
MTNEEPVPSTSCVLSAAEKNVKNPTPPSSSKKRKGLDIDALWRKKLKDVENQVSPEKSDTSSEGGTSSESVKVVKTTVSEEDEEVKSTTLVEEVKKEEEVVKITPPALLLPSKQQLLQEEVKKEEDSPPVYRSTRSSRKKAETEKTTTTTRKMTDLEDVKPNIKALQQQQHKKTPASFQCSNLDDGSVREAHKNQFEASCPVCKYNNSTGTKITILRKGENGNKK